MIVFKKNYKVIQFSTQQEYATYMMKCITDGTMLKINYTGHKNFIDVRPLNKMIENQYVYKDVRKWIEGLKDFVVIKRIRIRKNKRKHKKQSD